MNDNTLELSENLARLRQLLAEVYISYDHHKVKRILWLDYDRLPVGPYEKWAFTSICDLDGKHDPSFWSLVKGIRELEPVKSVGYVISLAKNQFLDRRLLA